MVHDYSEWDCTAGDICYGGCLASAQLTHDILTATTDEIEPLLTTR